MIAPLSNCSECPVKTTVNFNNREDVYKRLLKIQGNHLWYFKQIQKELIDCVNISEDLNISLKPHCKLTEEIMAELGANFRIENLTK